MRRNRIFMHLGRLLAACVAVTGLLASEHHGVVKSGGLPLPGATVTAIQGDKKLTTTTDDQGAYSFPDLADGVWTITVEMLGFGKHSEEVGIAPMAPSPVWDLKQLSASELKAALEAAKNPPAPAPPAASPAPAQNSEAKPVPATNAAAQPANPPANTPAQPAATSANAAAAANGGGRGRTSGSSGNNRPSLRNALAQNGQGGYQRVDVNAAGDNADGGMATENGEGANPDLAQSASDAFVVGGSISSGINMPQSNDWFGGGRGGMDGMGFGPGMGPGGMGGGPNLGECLRQSG